MKQQPGIKDRIIGCIVGGAIGDCLGGPYEGKALRAGGRKAPWAFSDDTQMTLATCEAVCEAGGIDPVGLASTFARWFARRRITGTGASTRKALIELSGGAHWALSGRGGEMAAGNGAAMRIAPLAFWLEPAKAEDRRTIRYVCRITHRNDEAYAGALAVVIAIRAAASAVTLHPPADFLALAADGLPDTSVRDRLRTLMEIQDTPTIPDVAGTYGCSGYVVESVPLALFAASRVWSEGFQETLEELVACGGDADTNASIAAQVMG
ncbi:MAG: ADP-ribosylglycohydrolase family protein, partial [Blastocatellia bacterium]